MTDIEKNIDNSNLESKEIIEENTEDVDNEEEILEDDEKLPFPNARVVRLMRESLDANKQIKSVVKKEMNLFLGRIVETICKKMNEFDYSYVDYGMFKQSIETFENIQTIELEKIRIIKALEKIKADCDVLVNDVERKFHE
jgi:histone H3/H4